MAGDVVARLDISGLERLTAELEPRASEIIRGVAKQVEALARAHAPRDMARPPKNINARVSGALKSSIEANPVSRLLWRIDVGQEYGIFHEPIEGLTDYKVYEIGGARMPARPFLTPSVERLRKTWESEWSKLFR